MLTWWSLGFAILLLAVASSSSTKITASLSSRSHTAPVKGSPGTGTGTSPNPRLRGQNITELYHQLRSRQFSLWNTNSERKGKTASAQDVDFHAVISSAAGVYMNESKSREYDFQQTVLVSTISFSTLATSTKLQDALASWLCTCFNYKFKSLIFVTTFPTNYTNQQVDQFLKQRSAAMKGIIKFVPYSLQFHSQFVPHRHSSRHALSHNLEDGQVPVSKILSILEVQSLGFDVIYVDINTLILQDFFPLWRRSWIPSVDIIVSLNQTACGFFPSHYLHLTVEPSQLQGLIGVSYFRSGAAIGGFLKHWVIQIAEKHRSREPNVLRVLENFNSTMTRQCNHGAPDALTDKYPKGANGQITHCVMDEFVIETVSTSMVCSGRAKFSTSPSYFRGLFNTRRFFERSQLKTPIFAPFAVLGPTSDGEEELWSFLEKDLQPTIKVNISSSTVSTSLSHDNPTAATKCVVPNLPAVFNSSLWLKLVEPAMEMTAITENRFTDGVPIKTFKYDTIYGRDLGRLREIPSADVFIALGYRWDEVKAVDLNDFETMFFGPEVPAAAAAHPAGVLVTKIGIIAQHAKHVKPTITTVSNKGFYDDDVETRIREWTELANKSHDLARNEHVKSKLLRAAGVYKNKDKSKALGIEKTVLVSVLGPNSQGSASRYVQLIKNWFCYCSANGYMPVTYLVSAANESQSMEQEFKSWGVTSDVELMTYPVELFWRLLARKNTPLYGNRMSYDGTIPSFDAHGALVMLVPLLEVLEQGFNVIYLDLDTAWLRDPVPFMTKGTADFNVQLEMRNCLLPSSVDFRYITEWERFEPNTGILHVRSTPKSIDFYRDWMYLIVAANIGNDQKVLEFPKMGARISFSCNEYLAHLDHNQTFQSTLTVRNSSAPTYCFFNEMLVQNGKVSLGCAKGMGGSRSEYILEMYEQGCRVGSDESSVLVPASERDLQHPKNQTIVPLMVHMNYCDHKINEMKGLGAWIANDEDSSPTASRCLPFDAKNTVHGQIAWAVEVPAAFRDIEIAKNKFRNGSVVQLHRMKYSYLVVGNTFRKIPDADTLYALGYSYKNISYMSIYSFPKLFTMGEDMPRMDYKGKFW